MICQCQSIYEMPWYMHFSDCPNIPMYVVCDCANTPPTIPIYRDSNNHLKGCSIFAGALTRAEADRIVSMINPKYTQGIEGAKVLGAPEITELSHPNPRCLECLAVSCICVQATCNYCQRDLLFCTCVIPPKEFKPEVKLPEPEPQRYISVTTEANSLILLIVILMVLCFGAGLFLGGAMFPIPE